MENSRRVGPGNGAGDRAVESTARAGAGEVRRQGTWSGGGVSLGSLFGVEIRIDWSLLIIFVLVTVSLGTGVLGAWHPEWTPLLTWGVALAAAVLFFVSILAHEMSHALVARAQAIPVRRITLFVFGGMAHMEREPPTPKSEFLMAIVGPVASLAIGLAAWGVGLLLAGPSLSSAEAIEEPARAMAQVGPVPTLLLWLGPVNVVLAVFNLVPGFPLDGGRVLRSLLWWGTSDLVKATRWAAGVGQVFGWALMALGAWNFLVAGFGGGLWMLLIGWFLNNAARMSYQQVLLRHALHGVRASDIMVTRLERVPPTMSARELVDAHIMSGDQRAFPVEVDQRFVGLVCFDDVRRLARDRWQDTPVGEFMTPLERLLTVPPEAPAERALSLMGRQDVDQVPVVTSQGRLLGLVRRQDIVKWLALHESDAQTQSAGMHGARAPA